MDIYLVSRTDGYRYDEHDSFVCIAESEERARNINPENGGMMDWDNISVFNTWTNKKENVVVEYLGKAKYGSKEGVVCASFNAG